MPKTPDQLIKEYKDLYDSLSQPQGIEKAACTLYVSIFEKLKRKDRVGKTVEFIRNDFYIQDNKRLQFSEDGQHDDAYLCAQIQQAYKLYWKEVLDLPLEANLCAKKNKPYFYPMDLSPPPRYIGAITGRTKS